MDHNRLEIILLACGILTLVALLSIVLWLGNRMRNAERRDSHESQRSYSEHPQGRECLFKEAFADHPDYHSPSIALDHESGPSFIATVRKRSQTIVGALQHELRDFGRNLKLESLAAESRSLLDGDPDLGPVGESGNDEKTAHDHSDTRTDTRRNSSSRRGSGLIMIHERPKKRKSEEITRWTSVRRG